MKEWAENNSNGVWVKSKLFAGNVLIARQFICASLESKQLLMFVKEVQKRCE